MRASRRALRLKSLLLLLLLLPAAPAATACRAAPDAGVPEQADGASELPPLGVMGTLPLYWPQGAGFGDVLAPGAAPGWVRTALARRHRLVPLDTLEAEALAGLRLLLLAQPRPLTPRENLALDRWVRGGGRLLLFADPMLTAPSPFPIGDRRRPQDVVLLSPILRRWGLELTFAEDDAQSGSAPASVEIAGVAVPVAAAGRFRSLPGGRCVLAADRVLAECPIGRGRVTVLADAAVLEGGGQPNTVAAAARSRALDVLVKRAFH